MTGPSIRSLVLRIALPMIAAALLGPAPAIAQSKTQTISLDPSPRLVPHKVTMQAATFKGRKALRVDGHEEKDVDRVVMLVGSDFHDGVIEVDLAGEPGPGAFPDARGFVGIAFRVAPEAKTFEAMYLRPTNGRADDQVRRNHAAQYISFPEYPWERMRKEFTSKYETYVDVVPGEWTKFRIEVRGEKAKLFVHGNPQPVLIVNDLKLGGERRGGIALWVGLGTIAHFANLRVTPY